MKVVFRSYGCSIVGRSNEVPPNQDYIERRLREGENWDNHMDRYGQAGANNDQGVDVESSGEAMELHFVAGLWTFTFLGRKTTFSCGYWVEKTTELIFRPGLRRFAAVAPAAISS